jgi:hypothetical protein
MRSTGRIVESVAKTRRVTAGEPRRPGASFLTGEGRRFARLCRVGVTGCRRRHLRLIVAIAAKLRVKSAKADQLPFVDFGETRKQAELGRS